MSDASYAEIAHLLPEGPPLCLTTHESPDGDAIGSLLGAGLALEAAGRDVCALPRRRRRRCRTSTASCRSSGSTASPRPTSSSASCGPSTAAARAASAPTEACSNGRCASSTSTTTTTTPASARSTSSMREASLHGADRRAPAARGRDRDRRASVAEALYVGLVTDTGRFQYSNTTPEAFRLAARLVDAGAQPARVFAAIWETVPFAKQRLLGIALEHARLEASGRLLVTWLTRDDYRSAGADEPFSEGVVDHLRAVEGVAVAALVREPRELDGPRHKVSLRGRDAGRGRLQDRARPRRRRARRRCRASPATRPSPRSSSSCARA